MKKEKLANDKDLKDADNACKYGTKKNGKCSFSSKYEVRTPPSAVGVRG